ncbi:hypothetical protein [Aeromicrobium chenweiae]|uniref:Uncharacterized protein n=1 Tax=Aeromicrobium chenweiae TaxID=2079793 RepID=A0A2S0WI01_9ACTN|nr:hypothetical protein [Aeromicrobium chenweiae]AWB90860.1 hypothetical protein C3E78_00665 [Aeromicrobium chenweiae]TGN32078.1 hypothetical protein E4L97_10175 [Aeromicrobium chenweiae]
MASRPLRTAASATSTFALVVAGIAATTTGAHAAPEDVDTQLCAGTPVWTGGFTAGQPVHGLTTTRGVTPEAFTGSYVDTLANGAGRGKDILLFSMEGSRITKTDRDGNVTVDAGIWSGMSGSPVYDADDNLIGAVAYGFSYGPSVIAGVTPAKDVLGIQGTQATAPSAAKVTIPASAGKRIAATTATKADDASVPTTLPHLTVPRVAVGTPGSVATKFTAKSRQMKKKFRTALPKFTSGASTTTLDPATAIVPGGNIATAFARGDVTLASVGTITAICGSKVFAFGHPDNFDGDKASETFHAASAAVIQEDTNGSFKMANIDTTPLGQITQDRLSGILGVLGKMPQETTVTTNTTVAGQRTQAVSHVSVPQALASTVASQVYNDVLDGLDAYANGGEAIASWTIAYTPSGGKPATYTRSQRLSYDAFFPEQLPFDIASDVEFLQYGSDRKVTINSVTINNQLKPDYNALRIAKVEYRKTTKIGKKTVRTWVPVKSGKRVSLKRGRSLSLLATLVPATPDSVAKPVKKRLNLKTSKGASGVGMARLSGGQSYYPMDESEFTIRMDEEDEEEFYMDEDPSPATLAEVLAALKAQPHNDSLIAEQLYMKSNGTQQRVTAKAMTPAVTRGSFNLSVRYKKR